MTLMCNRDQGRTRRVELLAGGFWGIAPTDGLVTLYEPY